MKKFYLPDFKSFNKISVLILLLVSLNTYAFASTNTIEVISKTNDEYQNLFASDSRNSDISDDGLLVVFSTETPRIVYEDPTTDADIYLKNTSTQEFTLISQNDAGEVGNGDSLHARMTPDGDFVVFDSVATNLVANDLNDSSDVFLYDVEAATLRLVSGISGEPVANSNSRTPAISDDGRWVVFTSDSTNLVSGDTNLTDDVFLFDTLNNTTTRISTTSANLEVLGSSTDPDISGDGNFVVFQSESTTLVAGDLNVVGDIFRKNLSTGEVIRVSVATGGTESDNESYIARSSYDGGIVAFISNATNLVGADNNSTMDAFIRDIAEDTTERVSVSSAEVESNAQTYTVDVSGDGTKVVFASEGTNLVADDTNLVADVFFRDLTGGTTSVLSLTYLDTFADDSVGLEDTSTISSNGEYALFTSNATNMVADYASEQYQIYYRDIANTTTTLVTLAPPSRALDNSATIAKVSDTGRYVAYETDAENIGAEITLSSSVIYHFDKQLDTAELVTWGIDDLSPDGASYLGDITSDGKKVVYTSEATNLVPDDTNGQPDLFLYNSDTNETTRLNLTPAGGESLGGVDAVAGLSVTGTGRYVVFTAATTDLVDDELGSAGDIFLKDLQEGITTKVTLGYDGTQADAGSGSPSISEDGRYIVYVSTATNLIEDDTNGSEDIFLFDSLTETTTLISRNAEGEIGNDNSNGPVISPDGKKVAFVSTATNLLDEATTGDAHIFLLNLETQALELVTVSSDEEIADVGSTSYMVVISATGRYVSFASDASNLTDDIDDIDYDVYQRDTLEGTTILLSMNNDDEPGDNYSLNPDMSSTGKYIVFYSDAENLIPPERRVNPHVYMVTMGAAFEVDPPASLVSTQSRNTFHKDAKCRAQTPAATTWILLRPLVKDGVSGIDLQWTQYTADKMHIRIDNGLDMYPWIIADSLNDGHEFIPNVSTSQKITLQPINACRTGNITLGLSYDLYPFGWFNN